jgi:DNA polymerase-3 subunit epsilon
LCTVRLSRTLYPEHKGHSLEKIINRHGIQVAARHRAFDDALAIKTFSDIAYQEKGPEKFSWAVGKQFAKATIPPNVKDTEVQAIPNKPGVYIFEDQEHRPLYIGKSVAMRSRVLSHFREDVNQAKEMKLSKSVRGVRTIETKNELEALLLESSLVKSLQPIHNKQLRPAERYFVLAHTINEQGYMSVRLEDIELSEQTDFRAIFGIYTSKAKAKTALENSARTFDLCPKLLGLDQAKQACFHYQLGKCKGACVGKEKPQLYNLRTQLAFQSSKITPWPYKSAVAIYDKQENGVVVRNWVILGYVATLSSGETEYRQVTQAFDLDSYRILRSYIPQPRSSYTIAPVDPNLLQQSGASFITPVDYSQVF